ncbi:hypothetical protein EVAR_39385_1 [Eumeta japonica]|uniref:Uncharacterized protein n=1 Tax=Eumeta variegata TaxID=151549 RepID=A0A4C1ZEF0_EUMVA|nr:hypothetical protein EVAR_39385_1 [Eumeta japonica]
MAASPTPLGLAPFSEVIAAPGLKVSESRVRWRFGVRIRGVTSGRFVAAAGRRGAGRGPSALKRARYGSIPWSSLADQTSYRRVPLTDLRRQNDIDRAPANCTKSSVHLASPSVRSRVLQYRTSALRRRDLTFLAHDVRPGRRDGATTTAAAKSQAL